MTPRHHAFPHRLHRASLMSRLLSIAFYMRLPRESFPTSSFGALHMLCAAMLHSFLKCSLQVNIGNLLNLYTIVTMQVQKFTSRADRIIPCHWYWIKRYTSCAVDFRRPAACHALRVII